MKQKTRGWWVIVLAVILAGALCRGNGMAAGQDPIVEPVDVSPHVYTNSDGEVVFKEFFQGLAMTRIEFFDPDSGSLLYGVSLQDGRLVGSKEGSSVGEDNGTFDASGAEVNYRYSAPSKIFLRLTEHNGELEKYMLIGGPANSSLRVSATLRAGNILYAHGKYRKGNEVIEKKRNVETDAYTETTFHDDGLVISRGYQSGLLQSERSVKQTNNEYVMPYRAEYLQGKLGYYMKYKYDKNIMTEVAVYDAQDNLVGKANPALAEDIFMKRDKVNDRKRLQVIQRGKDRWEEVAATMFADAP